jgi:hypothetical protein
MNFKYLIPQGICSKAWVKLPILENGGQLELAEISFNILLAPDSDLIVGMCILPLFEIDIYKRLRLGLASNPNEMQDLRNLILTFLCCLLAFKILTLAESDRILLLERPNFEPIIRFFNMCVK